MKIGLFGAVLTLFPDEIRRLQSLAKTIEFGEEKNSWDAFSMYSHSFDGGEYWVEFDDEVTMIATVKEAK